MKRIRHFVIICFLFNSLFAQIPSNIWMKSVTSSNKLYEEFLKIDTSIYLIEEETNREYNQGFGGPYIDREIIKKYYHGKYLFKNANKVIDEVNCILSSKPHKINARSLYLISLIVLKINDERYTNFLEKSLENLEAGNFDCSIKVDCEEIFSKLIFPTEYALLAKQKYLEKNYNKKSFGRLLEKIYTAKSLSNRLKSEIQYEIEYLTLNKKY
jgi:hypothetical protein